jgi:two-component system sensor histidine kinase/response regulator
LHWPWRVATQLKIHHLQRELQAQNEQLEAIVAERNRQLVEAHSRLKIFDRAKSEFLSLISHEFRTPLNGLVGVAELVLDGFFSSPEHDELREMFESSRRRILSILDDALTLTQIDVEGEKFSAAPVSLSRVLTRAMERAAEPARLRDVKLECLPAGKIDVVGEEELLITALHALAETGVKFASPGETVRIRYEAAVDSTRIIIDSSGTTIPASMVQNFFSPLSISEASVGGVDLGLRPTVA